MSLRHSLAWKISRFLTTAHAFLEWILPITQSYLLKKTILHVLKNSRKCSMFGDYDLWLCMAKSLSLNHLLFQSSFMLPLCLPSLLTLLNCLRVFTKILYGTISGLISSTLRLLMIILQVALKILIFRQSSNLWAWIGWLDCSTITSILGNRFHSTILSVFRGISIFSIPICVFPITCWIISPCLSEYH